MQIELNINVSNYYNTYTHTGQYGSHDEGNLEL